MPWVAALLLLASGLMAVILLARLLRSLKEAASWARFPQDNPMPVLRVTPGGKVLYANAAGQAMLASWTEAAGPSLPAELVQALGEAQQRQETRETILSCGDKLWSLLIAPVEQQPYLHLYGHDVTQAELSRRSLAQSEASYRALFDSATDALFIHDLESGAIQDVNRRMSQMFGYSLAEARQLGVGRLSAGEPPFDQKHAAELIAKAAAGQPQTFEWLSKAKDGRVFWSEVSLSRVELDGETRILANVRDISRRKDHEGQLKLAASFFDNALEGIMVTNAEGIIQMVNPGFTAITGYAAEEAVGRKPSLLRSQRHDQAFYRHMWNSLLSRGRWQGEVWNRRKSGEAYPQRMSITAINDHQGRAQHYLAVFHDISEIKRDQESMQRQAYHDPLTGLPNRLLLMDRLAMALARARRQGHMVAVLFGDLDNFKGVNDTLGHAAGDTLLVQVAARLEQTLRGEDTVARLGGDEFVMVLPGIGHANYADVAARRVVKSLNTPFDLDGERVAVTTSLGISLYPNDGSDPEGLLRAADKAMYHAKGQGGGRYAFWGSIKPDQQRVPDQQRA